MSKDRKLWREASWAVRRELAVGQGAGAAEREIGEVQMKLGKGRAERADR